MKALSLFSGIGGLDLAAEMAGIKVIGFCEIEPFPVEVLTKRFPGVPIFEDVRKLTAEVIRDRTGMDTSQSIDVVFGGFPCQDLSQAGKQVGLTGARSGLWFEMLRVISELRPRYVLAENVRGAVNLALDTVYANLVAEGYKVYPYVISASAVGAPHQRERLFVVGIREDVANAYCERYIHRQTELNTTEAGVDAQCNVTTVDTFMENTRCELRQGGCQCREVEREAREGVASDSEFSSGTLWPSPVASDGSCGGIISPDDTYIHQLNPDWVEQMMNFPEGWTDLEVDEPKPWAGWPAHLGESILWATPNCMDTLPSRSYEAMKKQALNGARKNRSRPGNLREQIDPEMCKAYEDASHENGGNVKAIEVHSQYPYEYPRTTTGCKDRAKRLKALGNAVVPAQAYPFFRAIAEIEKTIKEVA